MTRTQLHHAGLVAGLVAAALATSGCALAEWAGFAPNEVDPAAVRVPADTRAEPSRVVVRHVLVSYDGGGVRGATRTLDEASALARKVLALAQSGADFGELVRIYSDDRHADGTLALSNWGIPSRPDEIERERMVRGFGRLAFSLDPGQIGFLEHDPEESPFGWHVVLRVQ